MTTVINNPGGESESDSAAVIVVGVVVGIILITLFIIYGIPALRTATLPSNEQPKNTTTNINVTLPTLSPVSPTPTP